MEKFVFDGDNRLFICKPGITSIDIQSELYSDWKKELLTGSNTKWPQAFRTIGGDTLPGGVIIDGTYFLMNGWKLRPQEADHVLVLNGNLYLDSTESGDICVQTTGSWNVMVRQVVSNIVNAVVSSGSSPSAIASAVWADSSAMSLSSSVEFVSGSTTYLSSSMVSLSASNEVVYNAMQVMSSSIDFVSGSVYFLSSSMIGVSSSNVQVYEATVAMSSSVADVYERADVAAVSSSLAYERADVAAVSASIAAISASIAAEKTYILEKAEFGRWKITNNTMIFYALDNITPIVTFNLYDENGQPTMTNVFERVPV